ncbi:MAG: AmmeMemoRadiSam system radical SAM enzyme [Candidatus Zixiibacteriota bacterium]|nr:MAG: AmmeMemoRadiSam system radical SAM enzyme [candidate division Zixibacteria bacterium]
MDYVEARFYEKRDNRSVKCLLCPLECVIRPSKSGICDIRINIDGILYAAGYARTIALSIDPIEKKPLYHFKPGSDIVSIGPNGCNLSCGFCQNWSISQEKAPTRYISPEELLKFTRSGSSVGVSYTYTEPLIWYEYIYDSAGLLKEAGFATVIVSNGYINEEPAREIFKYIDAANFDLKSLKPEFYRKICKGKLENVQRAIIIAKEMGLHVEITNLLIPGYNDSDEDIDKLVDWIYSLDPSIVLHISRYFPNYKFNKNPTPPERLLYAYDAARKKLRYVYTGNIAGVGDSDTRCRKCDSILIRRNFYDVSVVGLDGNKCASCGAVSDIIV